MFMRWIKAAALVAAARGGLGGKLPGMERQTIQAEYDFIICGGMWLRILRRLCTNTHRLVGGTAGLVLANRLTESGKFRVLVLEAGPNPEIVAAYDTPGGNQLLGGNLLRTPPARDCRF